MYSPKINDIKGWFSLLADASEDMGDPVAAAKKQLSSHFGPLVDDVWRGGYKKMWPGSFKTALGERHPQFKGSMQHDCQG